LIMERSVGAEALQCVVNLSSRPILLPEGDVLLVSGSSTDGDSAAEFLPPDTAAWLHPL
jgi:hypothetical protein